MVDTPLGIVSRSNLIYLIDIDIAILSGGRENRVVAYRIEAESLHLLNHSWTVLIHRVSRDAEKEAEQDVYSNNTQPAFLLVVLFY